jgi:hypothetical protein
METKVCTSCLQELPLTKFKPAGKKYPGKKFAQCNRCLYVKYTRPNAQVKIDAIAEYKLARGCVDCGYNKHPNALEFDHLPGAVKSFNIGEKVGSYSLSRIMEEIAKCEVVCANCHAIRTSDRRIAVEMEVLV